MSESKRSAVSCGRCGALLAPSALLAEIAKESAFVGEEWTGRNKLMAENVARIGAQYRGRRMVALAGAEHRYVLRELLNKVPALAVKEFWKCHSYRQPSESGRGCYRVRFLLMERVMNESKLTSARICYLGTCLATLLLSARLWAGEGGLLAPDLISITTDSAEPARERPISVDEVLRSSPTELSRGLFQFGPVIEVVLNSDVTGMGYLLDLDTGRVLTTAQNMRPKRLATALGLRPEKAEPIWRAYLCGLGVDLINEDHLCGLAGCDLATAPAEKEKWDSLSAAEIVREADRLWRDTKPLRRNTMSWRGNSPVPHTFLFRTHEGNRGIFQITEVQGQPKQVKVRYKLARSLADRGSAP